MMSQKLLALTIILSLATAVAIPPNFQPSFHGPRPRVDNPSSQQVTSSQAFSTGAGNTDNANTADGTGNGGSDVYNCYYGSYTGFPDKSKWIEFDDMFNYAKNAMENSCANLGSSAFGPGDSDAQIQMIYNSIQQVAESSLVDHRFILAVIMQESIGCVNVGATANPDPSQPQNPGLMQSDNGVTFVGNSASASDQQASITQMIIDGTQGTAAGWGLVQCINEYGDIYEAARCYNSGTVVSSNLNDGGVATSSYVNDIANRMTGWLYTANGFSQC